VRASVNASIKAWQRWPASGLDHGRALVVNVPGSIASVRA